ncbi:MAG: 30S ribosomal protein S21 [Candidatus Roizmanbacteria bacterium]
MVIVRRNRIESPDSIWRRFGKINYEENLVDELRDRKYYKKPSIIKKEIEKNRRSNKKTNMKKRLMS